MLLFLRKYWIHLVAITAIGALVIVISIFTDYDLIGWTNKTEVSLSETSISVKELNDIGELVTAEYYGEVIKSLQGVYREQQSLDLKKIYDAIKGEWARVKQKYPGSRNRRLRRKFRGSKLQNTHGYDLLQQLTGLTDDQDFFDYVEANTYETLKSEFENGFRQLVRKETAISQGRRPPELVYLARGWVKAGFDLTQLKEVQYHGDTILLYGLEPIILDMDINPWYIPELGIKGFEIIKSENVKKLDFHDMALLKRACKERLKEDAMERKMLEYALRNGEASLASFFGLFNKGDVGQGNEPLVRIMISKYYFDREYILADQRIDSAEAVQVKELVRQDTAQLADQYYQDLGDQLVALDKFIIDLTENTIDVENDPAWDNFILSRYYNGSEE